MKNRIYTRDDCDLTDGNLYYFNSYGQLHNENGPAIECPWGYKVWAINGKVHRTDGPAIIDADGGTEWYLNGEYNRIDGPAIEYANGYKAWYINGKLIREEGEDEYICC